MPAPLPLLLGGGAVLLAMLLRKKSSDPATPAVTNVSNVPSTNEPMRPLPIIRPVTPIVMHPVPGLQPTTPEPTSYTYHIEGDTSTDSTPAALIVAWTSKSPAMDLMNALADANPSLQRVVVYDNVVYYPDPSSGVSGSMAGQRVTLPSGQSPNRSVGANDPAGTTFPNNAMPGFPGHWQSTGNQTPTLSPWQGGQTVTIPASWGPPQSSSLDGRWTKNV
jgi:hypothetical protein